MKMDQICFHCSEQWQVASVMETFGLHTVPWIEDHVTMRTRRSELDDWQRITAKLLFNEQLGIQLEIMQTVPSWFAPEEIFISHIGLHLQPDEAWPDLPLLQESITMYHTAPAFHDPQNAQFGRRYHYRICRMPHAPRVFLKFIKRLQDGHDRQDT